MSNVIDKLIIEIEGSITFLTRQEGNTIIIEEAKDHNEVAINNINGKSEFTFTEDIQKLVEEWLEKQHADTDRQKKYLSRLRKALKKDICKGQNMKVIEPSRGKSGDLFYSEGKTVLNRLSFEQWKKKFSKMNGRIATLYEYDIFIAYLMMKSKIELEKFTDDSSHFGNYWHHSKRKHKIDLSGAKKIVGYNFGIGNTYKIVSNPDNEKSFVLCGGSYLDSGIENPICYVGYDYDTNCICDYGVGIFVF